MRATGKGCSHARPLCQLGRRHFVRTRRMSAYCTNAANCRGSSRLYLAWHAPSPRDAARQPNPLPIDPSCCRRKFAARWSSVGVRDYAYMPSAFCNSGHLLGNERSIASKLEALTRSCQNKMKRSFTSCLLSAAASAETALDTQARESKGHHAS